MATRNWILSKAIIAGVILGTGTLQVLSDEVPQALQWDPWVSFAVSSRDLNHRPGNSSLNEDNAYIQLRLAATGSVFQRADFSWKVDTRTYLSSSNVVLFDDDTDTVREPNSDNNYYFQLREAWIRYHGLTSLPGEHLTLGLQRLRNGDGLWWDVDIESLTWQGDTTQLDWLLAVGEEFDTYRTNSDLITRADNTLRWFGNIAWDWTAYHNIGASFMQSKQDLKDLSQARQDTSIGANADSLWFGIKVSSGWDQRNPYRTFAYKAEWIMQQGESVQPFDGNMLTYRDISAQALDFGLRIDLERMSLGAMYTRASGGESAEESERFSQTGVHTNRTRAFGNRQYLFRFNEAFRADISNLTYHGLFATWNPDPKWESVLLLGHYQKTDNASPVYVGGREIDVIDGQSNVGKSVDINVTFYPEDGWFLNLNVLRLRAGFFDPGTGLTNQNNDYRITLESQFRY
ncbi:alginate export family protein [Alteromonas sediminis]|uniref:alginate export family protein n=1 Tax=Alteromonas sediminis TaxID=2259342 RepID=UPI001404DDDF|nr:alginate export family protein [Alteromonas sediminis]